MSVTQNAPVLPRLVFFDGNGLPLVGGLVYTYQAGTTTPQVTYQDGNAVTPNANPIVLDSFGSCKCWLAPSQLYDFQVYNSASSLQYTISNVSGLPAVLGTAAAANTGTTTGQSPQQIPTIDNVYALFLKQGLETIGVPAASMIPNSSSGTPAGGPSTFGNAWDFFQGLTFAQSIQSYASFMAFMPKSFSGGTTLQVVVYWSVNGTTTGNVVWGFNIQAMSNGSHEPTGSGSTLVMPASAATGTAMDLIATSRSSIGPIPGAAGGCQLNVILSRVGTNGSDTLAATAILRGIQVLYTVNATDDT